MARLARYITIDGQVLKVPQYLNRTVSGWQVRVRDQPSQHFADAHYGGAGQALTAAAQEVGTLLEQRSQTSAKAPHGNAIAKSTNYDLSVFVEHSFARIE